MPDNSTPSTADRLEMQRLLALVQSAQEKKAAGKPLTKREIDAIAKLEAKAHRERAESHLRRMPKGEFIGLCGGSSRLYINWRERLGFPWPAESDDVDVVEVLKWFRQRLVDGGNEQPAPPDAAELRGKRKQEYYDGEAAEAKYRALIRELVPTSEVEAVFNEIAAELSTALTLAERISPQATEHFVVALENSRKKITDRFARHANANGSPAAAGNHGQSDRARKAETRADAS